MSRQAAVLVALGSLATAAAIVSFGTWILLRRGRRPRPGTGRQENGISAAPGSGRISD